MAETLTMTLASVGGGLLGTIFFGGLWWTVRRGVTSKQPALWFLGSLTIRMSLAVAGFYFVSGGDWRRLVACLLGFFMASLFAKTLTWPPREDRSRGGKEANRASYSR
jgi:F1F0 ATPase subunit 2